MLQPAGSMQRLPISMLVSIRPNEPLSSLFKLMLSAAACSDAACMAPLACVGVAPTSAPAGFRTIGSMADPALHNMVVGFRSMRTAAAAVPISCGAACQAVASPSVGRQCFATAAQQAAKPQQQEGVSRSVTLRGTCVQLIHTISSRVPMCFSSAGISEVTAVKVVKYLVIGMIIVLTVRVMPYMGALNSCQPCASCTVSAAYIGPLWSTSGVDK